ncbi:MAG: aminopeptidase P family protein [Phycisphaeraceae bacterium]|nr:MAG: aminopeptidase P family protein [Phycisphaeraceae bacterium]
MTTTQSAKLLSGVPAINKAVFHQIRFDAHDPASIIVMPDGKRVLILRDVELMRAKTQAKADEVHCYEDFEPAEGLSGDREIRAAQATAVCLKRAGVTSVSVDRSLPMLVFDACMRAGISVSLDVNLGVKDRRQKDAEEVEALRTAQRITEGAIRMACELIAKTEANKNGVLLDPTRPGETLTAERVKGLITAHLAEHGALGEHHIIAGGPEGGDCHNGGSGVLRTEQPIIVDVFPKHLESGYHGDCTRMVVHGQIPDEVKKMHATVVEAKAAGIEAIRAGVTGEDVHRAVIGVITSHSYHTGFPPEGSPASYCSMPHGTGHGLGLDLKEPPLLDFKGPALLVGDAVTVEPGLYSMAVGGMRLEDLVIVTEDGCENLNELPEHLDWK